MAYATASQFVAAFTEEEVRQLAPLGVAPGWDAVRIDEALADASAFLDGYVASRFPTPVDPAPRILQAHTLSLAREALDRKNRESVKAAADRARAWAKDVSKGLVGLGAPTGSPDTPPSLAAGPAFSSPAPAFDAGLDRWLSGL